MTLFQIGIKKKSTILCYRSTSSGPSTLHMDLTSEAFGRDVYVTVRKILQALLREQITEDESLVTFMCEVESIMNSRPITPVSSDPNDMEPLTPNHLLLLKSELTLPPGLFKKEDSFSRRR